MTMTISGTNRLDRIQGLRAFAALAVVFGHVQHEALGLAYAKAHGFATLAVDWMGAGVDLFFAISGFVMVYASQKLFAAPGGARTFLARRAARIIPLYWGATTLFLLVLLSQPALLNSATGGMVEVVKSYLFIPYTNPANALMQPVYKLGWTLNYEMFFYMLFALVIGLRRQAATAALVGLLVALVVAGLVLRPERGPLSFWTHPIILEFGAGALIATMRLEGWRISKLAGVMLAVLAAAIFAASPIPSEVNGLDPLRPLYWGVPAAMLLAAAALSPSGEATSLISRIGTVLGDASYSIYLLHPILIRGLRIVWEKTGLAASASPWLFVAAVVIATIVVAMAAYCWFEKPLTDWLQKGKGGQSAAFPGSFSAQRG